MFEGRIAPEVIRKKPRIILDGRFGFEDGLEIGDKGQLDVNLMIDSARIDEETDKRFVTLLIVDAKQITSKSARIT